MTACPGAGYANLPEHLKVDGSLKLLLSLQKKRKSQNNACQVCHTIGERTPPLCYFLLLFFSQRIGDGAFPTTATAPSWRRRLSNDFGDGAFYIVACTALRQSQSVRTRRHASKRAMKTHLHATTAIGAYMRAWRHALHIMLLHHARGIVGRGMRSQQGRIARGAQV